MKSSQVILSLSLCCVGTAGAVGSYYLGSRDDVGVCFSAERAVGYGYTVRSLAEMNAIKHWIDVASKVHDTKVSWHTAEHKNLHCSKSGVDLRFVCAANARPCLAPVKDAKTAKARLSKPRAKTKSYMSIFAPRDSDLSSADISNRITGFR